MKARKIVAGLAAVSMLAAVSAQAVFAADKVTISAEKVTAEAGAAFTMNVELSGVPATGISVCEFAITYDAEVVTVTGVKAGAIAETGVDKNEPFEGLKAFEADYSTAGLITASYITGLEDSAYWMNEDGVFLTITGIVNEKAAEGDSTEFAIGAIERETVTGSDKANTEISMGSITEDYTVVACEVATVNGSVTVKKGNTDTSDGDKANYGDTNCDGEVNVLDVIVLNKNLLSGGEMSDQGIKNADVDLDGAPTVADSLTILKFIISLVEKLPV